jgi:hypothetical protein
MSQREIMSMSKTCRSEQHNEEFFCWVLVFTVVILEEKLVLNPAMSRTKSHEGNTPLSRCRCRQKDVTIICVKGIVRGLNKSGWQ